MESLITKIAQHAAFSHTELELIQSKFKRNQFRSKEFILKEGQDSTELHFIAVGLVRVFYLRDGKEITTYLSCDNGFVSAYSSFINQTKSAECLQCLEETETYSIHFKDMQELYETIPQWQKIGRILSENMVHCFAERFFKTHTIPAKEKYLDFLNTAEKKIIQRTPLIHIASFLGITPESLSRIRKEIS